MRRREQLRDVHEKIRSTRTGRATIRALIGLAGALVVGVGIILIPFPGPGWLIVLAGLAIWAIEFAWAQNLLHYTRHRLESWWRWLARQHWSVRALAGLSGLVFVSAVVLMSLRLSFGVRLSDIWAWILAN